LITQPTTQEEEGASQSWLFAFAFSGQALNDSANEGNLKAEILLCEARGGFTEKSVRSQH
jgi:hypothetical protein